MDNPQLLCYISNTLLLINDKLSRKVCVLIWRNIYIDGKIPTHYTIDENAVITNTETGKVLDGWIEKRGYRAVSLRITRDDGLYEFVRRTVHRIMALTFIPNPENKPQVNHKDGNRLNNHLDNLEWSTNKENNEHARAMGLIKTGDLLSYSSVSNETVHKICGLINEGKKILIS